MAIGTRCGSSLAGKRSQPRRLGRRQHDQVRCEPGCGFDQGRLRGVGAQVGDAPAVAAKGDPKADQAEVVKLAARACQEGARAAAAVPAAGESQQPAADQAGREMLLGDGRGPGLPTLAEVDKIGDDHLRDHGRGAQRRRAADASTAFAPDIIEPRQRLREPRALVLDPVPCGVWKLWPAALGHASGRCREHRLGRLPS